MRKPLGRVAIAAGALLALVLALISFEWPMPAWAREFLNKKLNQASIELHYEGAAFDFMGNVHLTGVHGHFQGLLDFSARQILLRLVTFHGPEAVVDAGELHTGFLRLPIPETILFSGTLQKRAEGFLLRGVRLKAGSLVMLVHGLYKTGLRPATHGNVKDPAISSFTLNSHRLAETKLKTALLFKVGAKIGEETSADSTDSVVTSETLQKLLASFLSKLCADQTLWVSRVELGSDSIALSLAGANLSFGGYQIASPIFNIQYPSARLSLLAESVSAPFGSADGVEIAYDSRDSDTWRLLARGADVMKTRLATISATARQPIASINDWKSIKDISASARLTAEDKSTGEKGNDAGGGDVLIDKVSFGSPDHSPTDFSARLQGRLPPRILAQYNVKVETVHPGFFFGNLDKGRLSFDVFGGRGNFYGLNFDRLRAEGVVSRGGLVIDHFDVAADDRRSRARGSLDYDFETRVANYTLTGEVNPLLLPWFGDWWGKTFAPFGKIYPSAALTLHVAPQKPVEACGIATAGRHRYKTLSLDKTCVSYEAKNGAAMVNFHTQKAAEELRGSLSCGREFSGSITGHALPQTLFRAYADAVPQAVGALQFSRPPQVAVTLNGGNYSLALTANEPVSFYCLRFDRLSVNARSDGKTTWLDPVSFGFAGGYGGANAQIGPAGAGYGSFWVRNARLGEWSFLGPLAQMLKTKWLGFAALKFDSADGALGFEPSRVDATSLNLWGDEHAATAAGSIDTQKQTLDFKVKLRTLGGSKPMFGFMAPLVQPFTSVLEARLTGSVQKPQWHWQLTTPTL